jgi:hypothetical protein
MLAKKGGKAAKGKGKGKAADADDQESDVEEVDIDALSKLMQKSLDFMQREFAGLQAGRATPSMLDHLQVCAH